MFAEAVDVLAAAGVAQNRTPLHSASVEDVVSMFAEGVIRSCAQYANASWRKRNSSRFTSRTTSAVGVKLCVCSVLLSGAMQKTLNCTCVLVLADDSKAEQHTQPNSTPSETEKTVTVCSATTVKEDVRTVYPELQCECV